MATPLYASPVHVCDMVMKGGITSGVVYPLAICEIARRFHFHSIGGTSAGAIAAAAAAAAECGRRRRAIGQPAGGFEQLEKLPDFLASEAPFARGSHLFNFFQPQPQTEKLYRVASAALGGGFPALWRVAAAAMAQFPVGTVLGLLSTCILGWLAPIPLAIAIGITIALLFTASEFLLRFLLTLPRNGFGLCSGLRESPPGGPPALTDWLAAYLNELAGQPQDRPLTFGDLKSTHASVAGRTIGGIHLEMMTTCLTLGRPFRLPFGDDESVKENRRFSFREAEFRRLFPASVVDWMIAHARRTPNAAAYRELGLVPLPDPEHLPVVVAARMSLSFPILLSAVPLYEMDRKPSAHAHRCWFSDGGICSNFPIHFFDGALPRWPTFCINLRPFDSRRAGRPPGVVMPRSNSDEVREARHPFNAAPSLARVASFLGSIIRTMQNWNDNMQSLMPGYRDRIAHVELDSHEGGLNLNMPPELIQILCERGRAAGKKLALRFSQGEPGCTLDWQNHRWVRLRTFLAALEDTLGSVERACAEPLDPAYEQWIRAINGSHLPSYRWGNRAQHEAAADLVADLRRIAQRLSQLERGLAHRSPRPRPELRARPRV
jgi:predicted acylesterase/phospholipase RssA